jgi:Outer membrane protein beta-barrel domain
MLFMRFLTFTFYFLLTSFLADAQLKKDHYIFKFGVRSVNVRTDNIYQKDNFSLKPIVDFGFGINYNIAKNLRFQPEIHYNPRGFKSRLDFIDSTFAENSLELHYLDLCPNFSYTFGEHQSFRTKLNVWGGPYIGFGVVGRNVLSGQTFNTKRTQRDSTYSVVNKRFTDGLNRIDYGFNVGVGLQFEKFTQVGLSYSMGFNNILDSKTVAIYNQSIGLYVMVLFDDIF